MKFVVLSKLKEKDQIASGILTASNIRKSIKSIKKSTKKSIKKYLKSIKKY